MCLRPASPCPELQGEADDPIDLADDWNIHLLHQGTAIVGKGKNQGLIEGIEDLDPHVRRSGIRTRTNLLYGLVPTSGYAIRPCGSRDSFHNEGLRRKTTIRSVGERGSSAFMHASAAISCGTLRYTTVPGCYRDPMFRPCPTARGAFGDLTGKSACRARSATRSKRTRRSR